MPGGEKIKKKKLTVNLPGRELTLYVAADIEALITDVSDEDKVPCWADVWPAAYGLAYFIWESVDFTPGKRSWNWGPAWVCRGLSVVLKVRSLPCRILTPCFGDGR